MFSQISQSTFSTFSICIFVVLFHPSFSLSNFSIYYLNQIILTLLLSPLSRSTFSPFITLLCLFALFTFTSTFSLYFLIPFPSLLSLFTFSLTSSLPLLVYHSTVSHFLTLLASLRSLITSHFYSLLFRN